MKTFSSSTDSFPVDRKSLFISLMGSSRHGENATFIASMLASRYAGEGAMPGRLGLAPESFATMMNYYFPGMMLPEDPGSDDGWRDRMPEYAELVSLFESCAVDDRPERAWIAAMTIAGCAGHHHLWEDLGLFSRSDLSAMLTVNFPVLAAANSRDMKWKKFIYKQLCEREGIYACPAPTCDACADFKVCFASEDAPTVSA